MEPDYLRNYTRDYRIMTTDLIDSGIGEEGRLQFILECIDKNKPLYKTDIKFLESSIKQLDLKIKSLEGGKKEKNIKNITNKNEKIQNYVPKTLLSDEHLDIHLDKIESRNNNDNNVVKKAKTIIMQAKEEEKKSFLRRIFSKSKQ